VGSVNLITSSSNSGKTRFLKEVVIHRRRFFQDPEKIRRVVFINANRRDHSFRHPWTKEEEEEEEEHDAPEEDAPADPDPHTDPSLGLEVVSLTLDDFLDPGSVLNAYDVVVFDDLLQLNEQVDYTLKYAAHHFRLFVFVVTQSCLSSPLYRLLQSAHTVVLLFGNTGCTRLAQHLLQTFFFCSDTKAYLKSILAIAEREQNIVLLKINSVASYRLHSHVLALTRVQGLFEEDPPYCFLYPELGHAKHLWPPHPAVMTQNPGEAAAAHSWTGILPHIRGSFLEEAFVLLPASRVRQWEDNRAAGAAKENDGEDEEDGSPEDLGAGAGAGDCLAEKRRQWIKLNAFLKREIEDSFPVRRWVPARNLMKGVLRCKELCVTPDHRTVFVKARPKWRFGIIDFLALASRKAGPGEQESDKVRAYVPLVNILLKNNVPETFFVNRLLLEAAVSEGRRGRQHRRRRRRHRYLPVGGLRGGGEGGGGGSRRSGPPWHPQQVLHPYSRGLLPPPPPPPPPPWPPGWVHGYGGDVGLRYGSGDTSHLYHV
jgi:hypothetical protein